MFYKLCYTTYTSVNDIQVFEVCDDVDEAFSDHQHKVEYASEGFKGVDSLRLQIHVIRNQFCCYNKFEMYL